MCMIVMKTAEAPRTVAATLGPVAGTPHGK
jgi:hypothetical protein